MLDVGFIYIYYKNAKFPKTSEVILVLKMYAFLDPWTHHG